MEFKLITAESTHTIFNVTKVKGYLKNGVVDILENHEYLMGLIHNNLVEIESSEELLTQKNRKDFFTLQNGIFIVARADSQNGIKKRETTICVYAKDSYKNILSQYEQKKQLLTLELGRENQNSSILNLMVKSSILRLKEEVEFLRSASIFAKTLMEAKSFNEA
jgi:hypothetical protein